MPKVDAKGRIVLPKEVREALGIDEGAEVEVREEAGRAVIEPEGDPTEIIERMETLIEEIPEERTPTPYDELDPQSKDHVETIREQASEESDE